MAVFTVIFDWGARSEALRAAHAKLGATKSFLLTKAPLPVALGSMAVTDTGVCWDIAPVAAMTVTPIAGTYTAKAEIPDTTKFVRFDFDLAVTAGGKSASCLEFRQLFSIAAGGALLPTSYSIEDVSITAGSPAPMRAKGSSLTGRREFLGACPLLKVSVGRVEINCEFLDVTELWWSLWAVNDRWGWYLDPDLGGRPDLLRVLAWTSGTAPMLWFVSISDLANGGPARTMKEKNDKKKPSPSDESAAESAKDTSSGSSRPGADVVFFRPPAGLNSFFYTADEAGFTASTHGDKTMFNLARWLLSPLPDAQLKAKVKKVGNSAKPNAVELAGMRIMPETPPPKIAPADPIDRVQQNVLWAFRPVGLEGALGRSGSPDMVFLPLGFDGIPGGAFGGGGYTALTRRGALAEVIQSARTLLWVRGAVGQDQNATPTFERQLWLAGHSAANGSMFECLGNNAADIDRILSDDATPANALLIPSGVPLVKTAAAVRKKLGKTLKAVFVTTPNMWKTKAEYQSIEQQLNATNADVVMLPEDAEWDDYWKHPPIATSNPHLFEVLREWENNGLASSKRFGTIRPPPPGQTMQWLFWHEWAAHGGHVVLTSGTPPSVDHIRTFFEDVLSLP